MRKTIDQSGPAAEATPGAGWLDLESLARVELSSEDPERPIEGALTGHNSHGWRAAGPGRQHLVIAFDQPRDVREIWLRFEASEPRTQEFCLEWSEDGGRSYREWVRQPFNFSPHGASVEEERYARSLTRVTHLKLTIIPDVAGGPARATLQSLRVR